MLTIAIVSVVLLPIAVDLAIGRLRPVKGDLPLKHR